MAFDHLVASPAARVMQTLETFFEGYGEMVETQWDRRIYLASPATLLDVIRDLPEQANNPLMAGHNPGLEELILALVPDDGASRLRGDVEEKFPTASLVVLDLAIENWSDVTENSASLVSFTRPRDLDSALGPETR